MRQSKYEPAVEVVEVLHSNPQYAHVMLPSGVESTVSIRDLAPCEGSVENDAAYIPPPIIHQSSSSIAEEESLEVPPSAILQPSLSSSATGQGANASSSEATYVQDEPVVFLTSPVDAPRVKRVSRRPRRTVYFWDEVTACRTCSVPLLIGIQWGNMGKRASDGYLGLRVFLY